MNNSTQRVELTLDDNGKIEDTQIASNTVRPGEVLEYAVTSAVWQFKGWMSNTATAIDAVAISEDGQTITLTIGDGEPGEEVRITLIYQRDMSDITMPAGAIMADPVIRSDDRIIHFA